MLIEVLEKRLGNFRPETLEALIPLLSESQTQRALIRIRYFQIKKTKSREGKYYNHNESCQLCADEFDVSESLVWKCIYNHKIGGIFD